MASVFKNATLVGTVGKIYELRTVGQQNKSVIDFSVGVTPRRRVSDDVWEDGLTTWTTCTAWGRLADNIAEGWNVGDRVFVVGHADMKPAYTNQETGVERPAKEVLIVEFAGHENSYAPSTQNRPARGDNAAAQPARNPAAAPKAAPKAAPAPADDDLGLDLDGFDAGDLPF